MEPRARTWTGAAAVGGLVAVLVGAGPHTDAAAADTASPRFATEGPRTDDCGAQQGYTVAAIFRPCFLVGLFSHFDRMWEGRAIRRADQPSPLARAAAVPAITYRHDGKTRTLATL